MPFGNFHPGVAVREELEARGMSAAALALKLRVPPQRLHEIIRGSRAITPETALRLALHFGNEPEFWMNLQTQYDLAELPKAKGAQIAAEGGEGGSSGRKSDPRWGLRGPAHRIRAPNSIHRRVCGRDVPATLHETRGHQCLRSALNANPSRIIFRRYRETT